MWTRWRLFQKCVVYTKFDIHVFAQLVLEKSRYKAEFKSMQTYTLVFNTYIVLWFLFCFSSSCVHYVASFSGLSILFLIAPSVFSIVYLQQSSWILPISIFKHVGMKKHDTENRFFLKRSFANGCIDAINLCNMLKDQTILIISYVCTVPIATKSLTTNTWCTIWTLTTLTLSATILCEICYMNGRNIVTLNP